MKKLYIGVILILIIMLSSCKTIGKRYDDSNADISEFAEEYNLIETLRMSREYMEYIIDDFEYRNWDSNYEFEGVHEEVLLTLAKNTDNEYVIFVVPQNSNINILILSEFPFPSRTQIKTIVTQYNLDEGADIDTDYLSFNEYYPHIEVAHFYDSIKEQVVFGTLFIIFIGVNEDTGYDVYLGIDSEGDYVFIECDNDFDYFNLIYSFSLH